MRHDVVIVGGGPAGMALARTLMLRGADVLVVGPQAPWTATYGAWRDDVEACELGGPLDSLLQGAWPTVRVVGHRTHLLPRPYVVFDNIALRASLMNGITVVDDVVLSAEHSLDSTRLRLQSGAELHAQLVFDATGSGALLAHRGRSSGAQTAYGVIVPPSAQHLLQRATIVPDVFTLMDWSVPPTFLYAAQFADGRILLEETSLYSTPPMEIDALRDRFIERFDGDGVDNALSIERVNIPMGAPLPARTTRIVGFGAAVGYVHPVTGYSLAASLRAADRVAHATMELLEQGVQGGVLTQAVWRAVWPEEFVRTRGWHDMGLQVLRSLPPVSLGKFFDAFFDLPPALWSAYLRIDSQPHEVRAAMLGVFRRVDTAMRLRLMSSPRALVRALVAR
jgi:lycopene beta-cyclase